MAETGLLIQMGIMLLVIGGFAGVLAGLLGVGGGIVLVPSFFYAFQTLGYDGPQLMQMCLATSLATIIVTSLRSVLSHNKKGAVETITPMKDTVGAVVGMLTAAALRSSTLQVVFGCLAIVIGIYMLFGRSGWRLRESMPGIAGTAVLSPMLGFGSVLMGIGGGSFGVPVMSLMNVPIHRAVATAAGFGVVIAVPSVIGFLFLEIAPAHRPPMTVGAVNLIAFALVVAMTLITTPWGVRLAHALDPGPLKRAFGVFLTLVALNMLRKAIWG